MLLTRDDTVCPTHQGLLRLELNFQSVGRALQLQHLSLASLQLLRTRHLLLVQLFCLKQDTLESSGKAPFRKPALSGSPPFPVGTDLSSEPLLRIPAVIGQHPLILTSHLIQNLVEVHSGGGVQFHAEPISKLLTKQVDFL